MRTELTGRRYVVRGRETNALELLAVGLFGAGSLHRRLEAMLQTGRSFSPRASSTRVAAGAALLAALIIAASSTPRWLGFAQQLPPAFDVSVVKPNASGSMLVHIQPSPGGRFNAENATPLLLLMSAWNVRDFQIVNAPAWMKSERFDVAAKSDAAPGSSQMSGPMLQALLTTRFKLALHHETRQLPVYVLTVGKSGAKLQASRAGSCKPWSPDSIVASPIRQPDAPIPCGFLGLQPVAGGWRLNMAGSTTAELAAALSMTRELHTSVIDESGVAGKFDIHLAWTSDASGDPSIFTAIQDQLGLKLEPRKSPVDVLVVDHAERPDAN